MATKKPDTKTPTVARTELPPGPYSVDESGDMYDCNGEIISMMAHAEPCDRVVFMNRLARAANAHKALVEAVKELSVLKSGYCFCSQQFRHTKHLLLRQGITIKDEHSPQCTAALAALALAGEGK